MATIRPFVIQDDLLVRGGDITTAATTSTVFNTTATTLDIGEAATAISIGASTGTTTINNNLVVTGTISGTLSSSTTSTQSGYFGDIFLFDDSTPSHYLQITNSANLTAARALSINVNDGDRTLSLSGNLTLANSLTTAGNFALTLTTTAVTNVTLPTSGTLATTGNLSQFAATTSAQLAGIISDETGTGALVFASSPTLTSPRISSGSSIADSNGNELILFPSTVASAVNEITVSNAATGASPSIAASGGDANVGLTIQTKGTGALVLDTGVGLGAIELRSGTGRVRIYDDNNSHYYAFVTGDRTANYNINLPAGDVTLQAGTMATTGGTLAQFAATTSAQLAGIISDETGSGALVFGTSPTITTSIVAGSASMDVFNTVATTVNAFGAATALNIGATTGTTTVRNNLVVSGDLRVDGTTTVVNSTVTTLDDPILTLGGDTATVETTKDRGIEFKYGGETLTITNYTGAGTTTVTGTVASTTGYAQGDIITISGATGTEQAKLNGTWVIASVPNSTTFTFTVTQTVAAGALTTGLGTTIKSKNGFFGFDQSTGRFTFIPQSNNTSEVYAGTLGDIDVRDGFFSGDVAINGGDLTTSATTASVFNANATTLNIGGAATTLSLANTGTAARSVNIATAATAGASTLTFGGAVTGNILKINSVAGGTVNLTTDVTTGSANIFTSITTGSVSIATGGASATTIGGNGASLTVGGTGGNSTLTINGNGTGGTVSLATNVTTGVANLFTGITTGTVAIATGGAATVNVGGAGANLNLGATTGNSTLTIRGNGTAGAATISTNVTTGSASIFTSVTGTVQIGGLNSNVYLGTQTAQSGNSTTVATTTQSAVDTFPAATFRSAEYLVQITQGTEYQISKILLVHDGTNVYLTEYGTITGPGSSALATLDADISTGNVRLLVTMGTATSAVIKTSKTAIIV